MAERAKSVGGQVNTGATVDAQATQNGNGVTIDMIVADISQGGRIGQAIQQNHQAPRKARG